MDDRWLCRLVQAEAGLPAAAAWTAGGASAAILKAVIARLDLLVGSRYHALVGALASGVPVCALGWAHKYAELLQPFGLAEFALEHHQLAPAAAGDMAAECYRRRASLRQAVGQVLPAIQAEVDRFFDRVADILSQGGRGS